MPCYAPGPEEEQNEQSHGGSARDDASPRNKNRNMTAKPSKLIAAKIMRRSFPALRQTNIALGRRNGVELSPV
jgi:hypothetical protein